MIDQNSDKFELICYNTADDFLRRTKLHGQYRLNPTNEQSYYTAGPSGSPITIDIDGGDVQLIDTPLIFNGPGGEPNMIDQTYKDTGFSPQAFPVFDVPFRNQVNATGETIQAQPWTLKDAVTYILCTSDLAWGLDPDSFATAIANITNNPQLGAVNCEGISVQEALRRLLEPYNYVFWIDPMPQPTGSHAYSSAGQHNIYIANKSSGMTTSTVTLPPRQTGSSSSSGGNTPNLIKIDVMEDATAVVNNISAIGDRIIVTTLMHTNPPTPSGSNPPVLKLYQGWASANLVWAYDSGTIVNPYDITFRRNYCSPELITIIGGAEVYGIGRLWRVNLGEIPAQNLESLNADLATASGEYNSIDPRRPEKPELYNQNAAGGILRQADVVVELSTDGGVNWAIAEKHWYQITPDGLGIVFTDVKALEVLGFKIVNNDVPSGKNYWQALHDNKLQIRVVCAVKSDSRLFTAKTNDGSVIPLANERQFENDGYRKSYMNPLVPDAIYYTQYAPYVNDQDDTTILTSAVNDTWTTTNRIMISGTAAVVYDAFGDYTCGMQLTGVDNRWTWDAGAYPTIMRVEYDLENQHVVMVFDNHNVLTPLRQPPITAENYRAHQLHVDTANPLPSGQGHKVPFGPGIDKDRMRSYEFGQGTYEFGE